MSNTSNGCHKGGVVASVDADATTGSEVPARGNKTELWRRNTALAFGLTFAICMPLAYYSSQHEVLALVRAFMLPLPF